MEQSILISTKKNLGLAPEYTVFDLDVITHINSVFSTLAQIGIGPDVGFMIEDDAAEWADFLNDDLHLNSVKTYVYLKVRMLFDPPQTSYHLTSMKEQIEELEMRLSYYRESLSWVDPDPEEVEE